MRLWYGWLADREYLKQSHGQTGKHLHTDTDVHGETKREAGEERAK